MANDSVKVDVVDVLILKFTVAVSLETYQVSIEPIKERILQAFESTLDVEAEERGWKRGNE